MNHNLSHCQFLYGSQAKNGWKKLQKEYFVTHVNLYEIKSNLLLL